MLITQAIDDLLGGVSQAVQRLRDSSQAQEQANLISHRVKGLRKRPPTLMTNRILNDGTGYDSAFNYELNRTAVDKYRVFIVNNDLLVFNVATGNQVTVVFPNGKAYLAGTGTDFRAVTIGDSIVIVNRTFVGGKNTSKKAPDGLSQAMVVVRQGDYSTTYTITLDGIAVSYKTPISSDPNGRTKIATDAIAASLMQAIVANTSLNSLFTITQFGNALHIIRQNSGQFRLTVTDGLSGNGLLAIKGQVQQFEDLPTVAKDGMVVEVVGSPESDADNYFVQYDDTQAVGQAGVWREVVRPGTLTDLDGVTLPHVLAFGGTILEGIQDAVMPQAPVCGSGAAGTTIVNGWSLNFGVAINETNDPILTQQLETVSVVPTGTNGTARTVTVTVDVDTRSLNSSDSITLAVTNNGTTVSSGGLTFGSGIYFPNLMIVCPIAAMAAASDIKLTLTYGSGATPPLLMAARITAHGKNNIGGPGVLTQTALAAQVTFDPVALYPAGSTVTVTLDGTNFTSASGADKTGAQLATELQGIIDPNATYIATNPSAGVIVITRTNGAFPVTSATFNFSPDVTLWVPTLGMTPSEHVGRIVKNTTDNSQGTITANTATTISVASLSGGSDNKFQAGDLCTIIGTGTYFVFKVAQWVPRKAGDDISNPFPPFVGRTIDDVFFYENRLGFTVGENVLASRTSSDYFNFFRTTVTDLIASDTIAVKPPGNRVVRFDNATPWVDGVYLFTEQGEFFRLSGQPVLTPTTVRIDVMGKYPVSRNVRPIVAGTRLVLCSTSPGGFTRVAFAEEVLSVASLSSVVVKDITKHVPTYLVGNPLAVAVDDKAELIFIITDGARSSSYVCSYGFQDDGTLGQLAWYRWDYTGDTIVTSIGILPGTLSLTTKHSDGLFWESLNVEPEDSNAYDKGKYLDRRLDAPTSLCPAVFSAGVTTWTLPYALATNGSQGVIVITKKSDGSQLPVGRPTTTTVTVVGDFSATPVVIGVQYQALYTASTFYRRNRNGVVDGTNKLTLRRMKVFATETGEMTVVVTRAGGKTSTKVVQIPALSVNATVTPESTNGIDIPIHCVNERATIQFTASGPGSFALTGFSWEGDINPRAQPV